MTNITNGIGSPTPKMILHIANRPELEKFEHNLFQTLKPGEAAEIIQQTSNHWRKVFSIMAKISFALFKNDCKTWQEYRDSILLTERGFEALDFTPINLPLSDNNIHIVCGFQYAESQLELSTFIPHLHYPKLLRHPSENCFVTPYFDWRQLNNELLAGLISVLPKS